MTARSVLWVLRRRSEEPISCVLRPVAGSSHLLSVMMAEKSVYSEHFDEERDALAHATFLLTDYIKSGWTDVVHLDSRLMVEPSPESPLAKATGKPPAAKRKAAKKR